MILFDDHQVVAALVQNLLGDVALRQQGIHGRDRAGEIAAGQQRRYGRDFVGFSRYGGLRQDIGTFVAHQTDQKGVLAVGTRPTDIFAIDGLAAHHRAIAQADGTLRAIDLIQVRRVSRNLAFQGGHVDMQQHTPPGGRARQAWPVRTQGVQQFLPVRLRPVDHGHDVFLAGGHCGGYQRQQVGPGKALAAGTAKVRNLAQIVQQGRLQRVHRRNFLVIGLTEILAAAFLFNRTHATITAGTRAKPHNDFALAQVCAIMTLPRPGRTIMPGP